MIRGFLTYGYYRYKTKTIHISYNFKFKYKIYVLVHELLHHIFYQMRDIPEMLLNKMIDDIDRKMWLKDRLNYQYAGEIIMLNPS